MVVQKQVTVWSDLDPMLRTDGSGNVKVRVNVDAVYGSIENIIKTAIGSRVMVRAFAGALRSMLFEPILDDQMRHFVSQQFKSVIEAWDNRVSVVGVDLNTQKDRSYVALTIQFYIRGYDQVFNTDVQIRK